MFDLSRSTAGTATDVSETSGVPRTRVFDATGCWRRGGDAAIRNRCLQLLAEADDGIVFVMGEDGLVTINRRLTSTGFVEADD